MSLLVPEIVVAVTPSNTVGNEKPSGVLFIGTAGDVKVDGAQSGTAVEFKNVPNGTFLRIRVKTVYSTDTTATDIVKCY